MVNSEFDMALSLSDLLQSFQNLSPLSLASSVVGSAAEGQCAANRICTTSSTKSLGSEATTEAKVTDSNTKPGADTNSSDLAGEFNYSTTKVNMKTIGMSCSTSSRHTCRRTNVR